MIKVLARGLLVCVLVASLVLSLTASVVASGKAVPASGLEKIVLIHYAGPDSAPGKPDGSPGKGPGGGGGGGGDEPSKDNSHYELLGPKWGSTPVSFRVDPDFGPEGAFDEIVAALEAWDAATPADVFAPAIEDPSASASPSAPDFVNTVTFRVLAGLPNALAVTIIWYWDVDGSGSRTEGDLMADTDVIFNTKFKWAIDPDGEGPLKADAKGKYYDVRNVATHEIGHVVGLADIYEDAYSELTMYGYAGVKETKKVSLEEGDILGTQALYGEYE
ncbi:MAG: matrixin family metalloprotease [Dehalococcoidia bacterium]